MSEELHLSLLGDLEVRLDGTPLHRLRSSKAKALLCYLAMTGRPHLRPTLLGLLWGDLPETRAQNNLSKILTYLRRAVGEHLRINRQAVAFDRESCYWLDVQAFETQVRRAFTMATPTQADVDRLAGAVELYRGDFLEGFYVRQAPAFEEWVLIQRARLKEWALRALHALVAHYIKQGETGTAAGIDYATRLLALEPWREETHRQLMRLLAKSGRRSAALAQYEACRKVLARELDVEPAQKTVALYEQIRTGKLEIPMAVRKSERPIRLPDILQEGAQGKELPKPVFVAREQELERLRGFLGRALAGQGCVLFVTGEAGSGKTALVQEFIRRAQAEHADLVVAGGICSALTGVGDPYLPFREILGLLTGDVESRAAGAISTEGARRLWNLIPHSIRFLVETSPDLIGTLIDGSLLAARAATAVPGDARWLDQLEALVAREKPGRGRASLEQADLLEQYANLLASLAADHPLLLAIDDLQWADVGSVSLLFHLGRRLEGSRILIVGLYRPADVAIGRNGKRHPLEPVIHEFQRCYGRTQVDLEQSEDRQFVEALLDSRPNRLGASFRKALYQRTKGHALFTVEILRRMKERGELVQDMVGQWIERSALDWTSLPAQVEGVICERINRLPAALYETLKVASVEGEDFTAEVVAQVRKADELEIIRQLRDELDRRHRLIKSQGRQQTAPGGQWISRYQFRHILFQTCIYNNLDQVECAILHKAGGNALEQLYVGQTEAIAIHLARHFQAAGHAKKAADYYLQAGDRARGLYAHLEAIDHYRCALKLFRETGHLERAARTLIKLGLTHYTTFEFEAARLAYEEGFVLWQRAQRAHPAIPLPSVPHALRLAVRSEPLSLDPAVASDMDNIALLGQLFSGLVDLDPDLDVVPDIAQSWEISQGGRQYVFHLREDASWSDGMPVTAEDFRYAWSRTLNPATRSPVANLLYDIKGARALHQGEGTDKDLGVRALDEATLAVELDRPVAHLLYLLTASATYPVPRHAVERYGQAWVETENIVTNGPFQLTALAPDRCITLSRHLAYHGRFTGNVERVEIALLSPENFRAGLAAYDADRLDIVLIPNQEIDLARQRHNGEYFTMPLLDTSYMAFDVSRPPFDDRRVRRAFALATDKETLVDMILGVGCFPAMGGFIPPDMPGYSAGIGLPFDPRQARQLLSEAGYPEGRNFPTVEALAIRDKVGSGHKYLQALWHKELGVETAWEAVDKTAFVDRLNKTSPQICVWAWGADYPDPSVFLVAGIEYMCRFTQWKNAAYDRLVKDAGRTMAPRERIRLYQEADRVLVDEAAIVPIEYRRYHLLIKPWVKRYPTSVMERWFWKDVIVEPHEVPGG